MHDLTSFQRDWMCVIAGRDSPKGDTIKEELDEYYDSDINHGRLYPNVDQLVEKEFIEKGRKDDRTSSYELTVRGEQESETRREWEDELLGAANLSATT